MGFFPTAPNDGDEIGPNTNGTYFKYVAVDDKWIIINNVDVSDLIYDESLWDANSDVATKNAIRDKIEGMDAEAHAYVEANALTLTADVTFNGGQLFDTKDVSTLCTTAEAIQAVEDAGLILSASKTINIDGTPADATYTGIVLDIDTTGCATYDAVYIDGLNSVAKADATDISKMPAIGVVIAVGKVLVLGVVRNDAAWAITAGNKIYVDDTTPGELVNTTTGLNEAGNIIQIMGVAVGNDMLYINPSLDWVEFVV